MSIQKDIQGKIKEAMLARESVRLVVLRSLLAGFTNELVAKGRKPQDVLTDEEAVAVIRRAVKQRKDSIEQFTAGNRPDLVEIEQLELKILDTFLPQLMSTEEIKKIAEAKKAELNITDKKEIGKFLGALMKDLKGKADGAEVKAVAESLFD